MMFKAAFFCHNGTLPLALLSIKSLYEIVVESENNWEAIISQHKLFSTCWNDLENGPNRATCDQLDVTIALRLLQRYTTFTLQPTTISLMYSLHSISFSLLRVLLVLKKMTLFETLLFGLFEVVHSYSV